MIVCVLQVEREGNVCVFLFCVVVCCVEMVERRIVSCGLLHL